MDPVLQAELRTAVIEGLTAVGWMRRVRRVRNADYWGAPVGTIITPGMRPRRKRKRNYLPSPERTLDEHERFEGVSAPGTKRRYKPPQERPPTYDDLEAQGRIGRAGEHYTHDERKTAVRATANGIDARSVAHAEQIEGRQPKSPDSVIEGTRETLEMKQITAEPPSAGTIQDAARRGRDQSRNLFISGYDAGLDIDTAFEGLDSILRSYGPDFDEILIEYRLPGGGFRAIHWP